MKKVSKRGLLFLMILLLPLCPALAASITPLEEMDLQSTYAQYFVEGPDLSLLYPVNGEVYQAIDEEGVKGVLLLSPEHAAAEYIFFAIYNPTLKGMDLLNATEKDIDALIDTISQRRGTIHADAPYTLPISQQPAVLIREAVGGMSASYHLVTLHGGWLLNMMAAPAADKQMLRKSDLAYQELLLDQMMSLAQRYIYTFTLEGTGFSMTAPGNIRLMVDYDEPDFKTVHLVGQNDQLGYVQLMFIKDDSFAGQTLNTLDDAAFDSLVSHLAPGEIARENIQTYSVNDNTAAGFVFGTEKTTQLAYLFGMNDGWALAVVGIVPAGMDAAVMDWLYATQGAIIRRFLGGDAALPAYPAQ